MLEDNYICQVNGVKLADILFSLSHWLPYRTVKTVPLDDTVDDELTSTVKN